jgi:3-hydroxyisobutyrate dehydrogenase-like beta-hydroxyacid dehydrogenase
MAHRIVGAGYPLTVWARRAQSLEPFVDTRASIARSPEELATLSDVVCICVVNDADVEAVVLGEEGLLEGMNAGGVIVVHSTVHPATCHGLAERAAHHAVDVLDAPVSGGGVAAAEGALLVMVGGDETVVERVRPIFATYGSPVLHLGALGSGQMAKLLNNLLFTAQLTVAEEAFDFAAQLGIDRSAMADVLTSGSGGSRAAGIVAGSGFDTSGLRNMAAALLAKDVGIIFDVADHAGAARPRFVSELARATLAGFAGES